MNSNYGKSGTPLNNFDFDLGVGSNRPRTLNDQKNKSNSSSYTSQSSTTPSWQPGKPSWTHQPAPSHIGVTRSELGGPTSMIGDISGKSWNSSSDIGIGIVNKNPNLFGDLLNSALGQNKSSSNAPLKTAPPAKSPFSMGGIADSLPKTSNSSVKSGGNAWGSSGSSGNVSYGNNSMNKTANLGGPTLGSVGRGGVLGAGMSSSKDPFGSLVDFPSKPMGGVGLNSASKTKPLTTSDNVDIGGFQNAPKPNASAFPSASIPTLDSFPLFPSQKPSPSQPAVDDFDSLFPSSSASDGNASAFPSASIPTVDNFPLFLSQKPSPSQPAVDNFDSLFPSSSASGGNASGTTTSEQQFLGGDDWGFHTQFEGGHDEGTTTELDGLPPPPSGVSASTAKTKGLDNYKQGQYADAIKWLSWAEILLEKMGDTAGATEILTCRASCYKEAGEYKKAVADCTKVLDHDGKNVAVLVQRALLYESMEKYRLGADDLRTVMKLDPGNRVARSTIHRLNKMAN